MFFSKAHRFMKLIFVEWYKHLKHQYGTFNDISCHISWLAQNQYEILMKENFEEVSEFPRHASVFS